MNMEIGTEAALYISFSGIHKWDFHCSAPTVETGQAQNFSYEFIKNIKTLLTMTGLRKSFLKHQLVWTQKC
jgi:hypothetical protein